MKPETKEMLEAIRSNPNGKSATEIAVIIDAILELHEELVTPNTSPIVPATGV